ncbi:MAG: tetratricopeptide repeat protein [Dongiaceae bacterium]
MTDILDEIEEDLQRERWVKLWQKYGNWVIGAALAAVLITAGSVGVERYRQYQRGQDAEKLATATRYIDITRFEEALPVLNRLAGEGTGGYAALAGFKAAALKLEQKDFKGAIEAYEAIAANRRVDSLYRDLAAIYSAGRQVQTGKYDAAVLNTKLMPLTGEGRPFRFAAMEIQGAIALDQGHRDAAKSIFAQLAILPDVPPGIKNRATQVLAAQFGEG